VSHTAPGRREIDKEWNLHTEGFTVSEGTCVMNPADKPKPSSSSQERSRVRLAIRPSEPPMTGLLRGARIDQKLILARALLAELPPNDSRVSLVQAAVLRSDEGLLDAVLSSLMARDAG
jgi:hypothetical protein